MAPSEKTIYTMGHSTHSLDVFVEMLTSFGVEVLADIRRYPGSRRHPHFNKESLEKSLPERGIEYHHIEALGGRRRAAADSKNTGLRHPAFRGYADYMDTEDFKNAVMGLEKMARKQKTAIMCSEAVWWSCHRSLVSDYLKAHGWKVMHIMGAGKTSEHPYTSAVRIVNGEPDYKGLGL